MKGEAVFLYAFDVASEIEVEHVSTVLSQRPSRYSIELGPTQPKDVPFHQPLAVTPEPLSTTMGGKLVDYRVCIYEVGVISFAMRVTFDVQSLAELMPFHNPRLDDGKMLDTVAQEIC